MDLSTALYGFMDMARDDPKIGPSHISLFTGILYFYQQQEYSMPISVFSRNLMKIAKIAGTGTYFKCMHDLMEMGYIRYLPSYNPALGSCIFISEDKCKSIIV